MDWNIEEINLGGKIDESHGRKEMIHGLNRKK
jgi:hypothetical protein